MILIIVIKKRHTYPTSSLKNDRFKMALFWIFVGVVRKGVEITFNFIQARRKQISIKGGLGTNRKNFLVTKLQS